MCNCCSANRADIMESESFKKCVDFHGHICPGLSIGYKAATEAMRRLNEERSPDEEIVAVVETDACSADAVQVLTGCTFGKGNFIYKDHGKMVLTLFSRNSGRGVRLSMRPNMMSPNEEHSALIQKVRSGEATKEETDRFHELHSQRSRDILLTPADALFNIRTVQMTPPSKAVIEPSEPCFICGEPTMRTKLEMVDDKKICRGCL
ncbi:MAG: formylmethanofuran dehydrogenase [Desulfamplus sp.]|nr:formylmethanofuran dehydrogenase [Desulfamplus sp.]